MLHTHSNSHPFVQSIARINDSGTFETSFEVKYLQSTPQRQRNRRLSERERDNLLRFVKELETLQPLSNSAKSTPKKSVNIGNTNSQSLDQTPVCRTASSYSGTSSRSTTRFLQDSDMGCKPLTSCVADATNNDESLLQLTSDGSGSADSSFDMHPPLLPLFNVTPPSKQQRNTAYDLARFLRGSFHVKRAKVAHLRRSLSDNENFQNTDLIPSSQLRSKILDEVTGEKKQKKNVLEETTNRRTRGSTSSVCTLLFPGNTSPFRRVWEQSSLRSPRTNKYDLHGKQNSSTLRSSTSMIASDSNVFYDISRNSESCTNIEADRGNTKISMRGQSEKLLTSQYNGVKSWARSFEHLLQEPAALATFAEFLKLEFSAENIYFWTICERYRNTECLADRQVLAKQIFQKYLANGCREPVNLDSRSRNLSDDMLQNAERNLFVAAQKQIFHLMKFDSYQRFIRSDLYKTCIQAEEKDQPLPFGGENLDALLKTNHSQNSSPKLKKSASNAEDRRRKIVLPWQRKTRCKSRDRVDISSEESCKGIKDSYNEPSNGPSNPLISSSKLTTLSSTLPAQSKPPSENSNGHVQQSLRSSLPTSLKVVESGCSLCRVKFCDGATTIVQIKPNETIQQLVERVLEKRGLHYKFYDVVIKGHSKVIDLQASTQELAGEEVEIEQRITFKLYLPDPKVISVKSKPKKYLHEVVKPILQKYNYELETVNVLRRDNHEKIDLDELVATVDGLRLQIAITKNINSDLLVNYQNDNISMKWTKSKELANEIVAENATGNTLPSNFLNSQNNLDEITNSIFSDIIQDKAKPENKLQPIDQYSIKSEECGSEVSSIFSTLNNKKNSLGLSMIRLKNKPYIPNNQHSMETNTSSSSSQASNEFNKPIIAKLKAGVKLQVTERVAEKQDELLVSLKSRLDNQSGAELHDNVNLNDEITAVNLRRVKANLSPINKISPMNEQPSSRHSLSHRIRLNRNSNETANQIEYDATTNAANKGPPPLPPKPKVLPTKPSNWGFNMFDQTTLQ